MQKSLCVKASRIGVTVLRASRAEELVCDSETTPGWSALATPPTETKEMKRPPLSIGLPQRCEPRPGQETCSPFGASPDVTDH